MFVDSIGLYIEQFKSYIKNKVIFKQYEIDKNAPFLEQFKMFVLRYCIVILLIINLILTNY